MPASTANDGQILVLLIDDDEDDYVLTRDLLSEIKNVRYTLEWVSTYEKAVPAICTNKYDAVLLDYKLGAKSGLDLLSEVRRLGCDAPVIILTGMSDAEIDLAAMRGGAADYIEKSRLDQTLLDRTIRYAIRQRLVESELERRVAHRTEELNRAVAALRDADRRKDEFLATLAHELRNPLAPIRNALEIMRLSADQPDVLTTARSLIDRQVAQLVRLIDDLLDVSRITHGKLRLTCERLRLSDVIETAIEQSKPVLDSAGQHLQIELPDEVIWLNGDRVRLTQVFVNLLNNAAKFSEPGGNVDIRATRNLSAVSICVRDTGVGIAPELFANLFDPFVQSDRTLSRAKGGLGIGLSLARRLVELHDGRIEAKSAGRGRGAEFIVTLPCEVT